MSSRFSFVFLGGRGAALNLFVQMTYILNFAVTSYFHLAGKSMAIIGQRSGSRPAAGDVW